MQPDAAARAVARAHMVDTQILARGVRDPRVLAAMRAVPRELFTPGPRRAEAFDDTPLPIGEGQTISQPYLVALMTELAATGPGTRVLEVGTGSGYQTAVLAAAGAEVFSIEIVAALARRAAALLADLGVAGVHLRVGDGWNGWPEAAPFDAILVAAAPDTVPGPLLAQLREGGRLVIPVGGEEQELQVHTRTTRGFATRTVLPVRFVPMTGRARGGG